MNSLFAFESVTPTSTKEPERMNIQTSLPTIHTAIERITPERAALYLEKNTNNRNMRKRHVERLANDIANHRWQMNGAAIVFNGDGILMDGQHRLAAIVEADCPVDMLVVRGVHTSAMETIDGNIARSASDVAKLNGFTNTTNLTAVVRMLNAVKTGNTYQSLSTSAIMDILRRHPHIPDAVSACNPLPRSVSHSVVGAWYYMARYMANHPLADDAMNVMVSGKPFFLDGFDPIHSLRERMLRDGTNMLSSQSGRLRMMWTMIGVWNAFIYGESIQFPKLRQNSVQMDGVNYGDI